MNKKFLLPSILCLAAPFSPLLGQTWEGDVDNLWATPGNWSTGSIPVNGGNVIFSTATSYGPDLGATNSGNLTSVLFDDANTTNAYNIVGASGIISIATGGTVTVESTSLVHSVARLGGFATSTTDFSIDVQGAATNFVIGTSFRIEDDFVKNGAGKLTLNSTTNTIANGSSTLAVNAGTIDITGDDLGDPGSGGFTSFTSAASTVVTNSGGTVRNLGIGAGNSGSFTAAGNITGNLSLQKGRAAQSDTNTQILTVTNTYTGTTIVAAGTLLVNGSHTGGGSYTVNGRTGATTGDGILGGNGTINVGSNTITIGNTAVVGASIGRLQAGSAASTIGTLTMTAATLTLNPESIFTVDLNSVTSNTIDLVNLTGNTVIGSGATLSLNSLAGFTAGTFFNGTSSYTFLDYSGSLTGTFTLDAPSTTLLSTNNYEVFYDTANTRVLIQAIPEPGTGLLLGMALSALLIFRRRRSNV